MDLNSGTIVFRMGVGIKRYRYGAKQAFKSGGIGPVRSGALGSSLTGTNFSFSLVGDDALTFSIVNPRSRLLAAAAEVGDLVGFGDVDSEDGFSFFVFGACRPTL